MAQRAPPFLLALLFLGACTVPNPAYDEASKPNDLAPVSDAGDSLGNLMVPPTVGLACASPGCLAPTNLAGQVAAWTFDDANDLGKEWGGRHPAEAAGAVASIPGPCGHQNAVLLQSSYLSVANDAAWELTAGSIDLWVRMPSGLSGSLWGLLSRDAKFTARPGHFSLMLGKEKQVVARIQGSETDVFLCSEFALPEGKWTHLAVNFGPPAAEFFVNGVSQRGEGTVAPFNEICGRNAATGITGNENTWAIGANTWYGPEGMFAPSNVFVGGAIDHLRITSQRQDWSLVQTCLATQ